ncbi:MAG: hypothetical protein OEW69_12220 [Nitrospirota bacterium]|nr:hypothetical protein [Nitrospirota bacterium]
MSKKKLLCKIKHQNETLCFMRETTNGLVLGFPKERPLSHLTWIFKQGRFSIHFTEEAKNGSDKYDKNARVEFSMSSDVLEQLTRLDVMKYFVECNLSNMPGKAYLGGYLQPLMDEKIQGDTNLHLEKLISQFYIVRVRHLRFCRDKIWVVLEKEKGRNGLWYDIGFLYGSFHNRLFYFSYEGLNNLYASLTDILGTDKPHMVECTADAIFCLSKPDIKILIRRGKNVLRRKS